MAWSGSWEALCSYLRDFTNIGGLAYLALWLAWYALVLRASAAIG